MVSIYGRSISRQKPTNGISNNDVKISNDELFELLNSNTPKKNPIQKSFFFFCIHILINIFRIVCIFMNVWSTGLGIVYMGVWNTDIVTYASVRLCGIKTSM